MSAISNFLSFLRSAIYAIDVRDGIADAIEQCYNDVNNPTLKTEALEAALQTKIDEGKMAALTIGDGTITGAKLANGTIPKAKLDPSITFDADSAFDTTSTNAIQNKVVAGAISTLQADLEDLDERVDVLEGGSGGSGLTDAVKTALMNLVNHLAWDDDDPSGQSYITALYDALYPPAPPASLTGITAVYTQSGTVYDTDSLDSLKSDLVVTAHYSDSTTGVVTGYTLSGTLAAGTSTITVSYSGKTTTFTVTVTSDTGLYPLENGSHTFTANDRVLTVTNGNHFVYEWPNATSAAVKGAYLNLSTVSDNDTSATESSNITLNDVLFTIPANAQVVFAIKNISFSNVGAGGSNKYAFNMRNGSTALDFASGDKGVNDTADIIIEKTVEADTPVTCIYLYASRQFSRFEADISLTVNNVRWI